VSREERKQVREVARGGERNRGIEERRGNRGGERAQRRS
jgi:hypothetical protein